MDKFENVFLEQYFLIQAINFMLICRIFVCEVNNMYTYKFNIALIFQMGKDFTGRILLKNNCFLKSSKK